MARKREGTLRGMQKFRFLMPRQIWIMRTNLLRGIQVRLLIWSSLFDLCLFACFCQSTWFLERVWVRHPTLGYKQLCKRNRRTGSNIFSRTCLEVQLGTLLLYKCLKNFIQHWIVIPTVGNASLLWRQNIQGGVPRWIAIYSAWQLINVNTAAFFFFFFFEAALIATSSTDVFTDVLSHWLL